MMSDDPEWRRLNRANWDERVAVHLGPRGYDLRRLRAGLPRDCLLVIDAAYADYVSRNDYESGI